MARALLRGAVSISLAGTPLRLCRHLASAPSAACLVSDRDFFRVASFKPIGNPQSRIWGGAVTGARSPSTTKSMAVPLELETYDIENPKELNFILGHSHFIKTVEDIYEALIQSGTAIKFGLAFCEASEGGPGMEGRKVRFDGNDAELIELAKRNAMAIGAGHSFIVFIDNAFPVNCLNAIKAVPEVCRVHCATANPTTVVLARLGPDRKGILGVVDGLCPTAYETEADQQARRDFLRVIGYKR